MNCTFTFIKCLRSTLHRFVRIPPLPLFLNALKSMDYRSILNRMCCCKWGKSVCFVEGRFWLLHIFDTVKPWIFRAWLCLWIIGPIVAIGVEKIRLHYNPPEPVNYDTRLFDIMYPYEEAEPKPTPRPYLKEREGKSRSADPPTLG